MPILEKFRIETSATEINVTCTNLDCSVRVRKAIEGGTENKFVISTLFHDLLKTLSEDTIDLTMGERQKANIKTGAKTFNISIEDGDLFPQTESIEEPLFVIGVEASELLKALNKTVRVIDSHDMSSTRGLFIELKGDKLKITGTDKTVLSVVTLQPNVTEGEGSVILSLETAQTLMKNLALISGGIRLQGGKTYFTASTEDFFFTGRVVEEKYPNIDKVIPVEESATATVQRKAFEGIIKRMNYIIEKGGSIIWRVGGGQIIVSAESTEHGRSAEETIEAVTAGEIEIKFSPTQYLKVFQQVEEDEVHFIFKNPNSALKTMEAGQLILVMPKR